MEHLAATLKRGGIKDLLQFFPSNKRTVANFDAYWKERGLVVVSEWYAKRRFAVMKEIVAVGIKGLVEKEEDADAVSSP